MSDWKSAKNILCIRCDAMGDVLMTTPAMKLLKESVPGRNLTLLTSSEGAKIAESIPLFHEVLSYDAPWVKSNNGETDHGTDLAMIERLRAKEFDAAIIFTVYSQNPLPAALLCHLAGIPLRAAYCRENPYKLLTQWVKDPEPSKVLRHETRRHLDLIQELGCSGVNLPLVLSVEEKSKWALLDKLRSLGVSQRENWIVIHPGATAPSRRYSAQGFAEAADKLALLGHKILFTGADSERALISEIQSKMSQASLNLGGLLTLKEMIALVRLSPLLISNNSGPVHMAAALGTPVVVLYALTNPQHTPWLVPHRILYHNVDCKFCYKSICPQGTNACLNNIEADAIVESSLELLENEEAPSYDFLAINPLTNETLEFA